VARTRYTEIKRRLDGSAQEFDCELLRRTDDGSDPTAMTVSQTITFKYAIHDALDFCPGNTLQKDSFTIDRLEYNEMITVLSRLEASGLARDVEYNVAYHRDLPKWQPMFESGCTVKRNFEDAEWSTISRDFANPAQLLLHTCDTGGASSGSPLLVDGPDGPEVVGINVGTYVQSKVIMLNGEVLHRFKSDDVANTGVNSLAFNETTPTGSVVTGTMTGFTYLTGGLNTMGCDGTGDFFCFKANTAPSAPPARPSTPLSTKL